MLSALQSDKLVADTLLLAPGEGEPLAGLERDGVLTVRPVALPRGECLRGANRMLGWPVGIMCGRTLLCAYHQQIYHHGEGPKRDDDSCEAVVVRSADGGETWSSPVAMKDVGRNHEPTVLGFGNCFGVQDRVAFLATQYGLFRSQDEGVTWDFVEGALTQRQTGHDDAGEFGPRMVVHPRKGLVVLAGMYSESCLDVYNSTDSGVTWAHERIVTPSPVHTLEPTAIFHDGHLLFLTRNHAMPTIYQRGLNENQPPAMMVSDGDWFPMKHAALTNIASYRWPDTTDLDFNPVTGRYDAIVTNRNGGGPGGEQDEEHAQTLNLWSISRDDFLAGRAENWRFEYTLLRLPSGMLGMGPDDIDAAHPGGAVMDLSRGVQHIFIYCGRYATPTGIYRLTRSLDYR